MGDSNGGGEEAERLRRLFEGLPQGIVFQQPDGQIVDANPAAERILGLPRQRLIGRTSADERWGAIRPDGSPFPGEEHPAMAALHSGEPVHGVRMGVQRPGEDTRRWLEVSAVPLVRPGQQRPYLAFTVFQDVTVLQRAEQQLRASEELYRTLVETSPDGITVTDLEGTIQRSNRRAAELHGFDDPDELAGRSALELVAPQERELARERMRQTLLEGRSGPVEYRLLRADDSVFDGSITASLLRDSAGAPRGQMGITRDVTARKRIERMALLQRDLAQQLATSESTEQALAASLDAALEATALELGCAYVMNPRTGALEQAANRNVSAQFAAATARFPADARETVAIAAGVPRYLSLADPSYPVDADPRRDEGLRSTAVLPLCFEGSVLGALALGSREAERTAPGDRVVLESIAAQAGSVLARLRQREERDALQQQLIQSQKMEAIGRLAGGVAHDFNNLLTGIGGFTEMVLDQLSPGDPVHTDMLEIRRAAERAAALTGQLLAFSRKQIIDPRVLRINEVVDRARKMLARIIGEDIELRFFPGADLWAVRADPSQIDQVLVNLATNARDAMHDGGKLTIETQNVEVDAEYARGQADARVGPYVLLAVSDDGAGIDPQTLPHVFEPFFTTKERGQGTGLGLATVYGVVRQGGGFVHVYSEPGVGTTVKLYFPRVDEQADPLDADERQLRGGKETVLVVEDEDMVRSLARRILERHGYRVLEARDGGEAYLISEREAGSIDLLVTDVVMPRMNGRELHRRLVARRPGLRVVFMSGYTENVIAHHGVLEAGTRFIQKPFATEVLLRSVRDALDDA